MERIRNYFKNRESNLFIAFVASLAVHIVLMTSILIINPADKLKNKPHTRVDFLGPLLKRTAFDIMIESVEPTTQTRFEMAPELRDGVLLRPKPNQRFAGANEISDDDLYLGINESIIDELSDRKSIPGFLLKSKNDLTAEPGDVIEVTHVKFILDEGSSPGTVDLRGEKIFIRVKIRLSSDGVVQKAEPVTTTGYPEIDMAAIKFVKGMTIKKDLKYSDDEWQEIIVDISERGGI